MLGEGVPSEECGCHPFLSSTCGDSFKLEGVRGIGSFSCGLHCHRNPICVLVKSSLMGSQLSAFLLFDQAQRCAVRSLAVTVMCN